MGTEFKKIRLWVEFVMLFVCVPLLLAGLQNAEIPVPIIPVLMVFAATVWLLNCRQEAFTPAALVRVRTVPRREWMMMFARFAIGATALTLALLYKMPGEFLAFPKENPRFWPVVMVFYPLCSVFAQGIVYRALYWNRYSQLFPDRLKIMAGAAVFAFAHLPYANLYALAFPFVGGLMFLSSYRRTRSLMFAAIEHALYGDFLFTIGWGESFFHAGILRMLGNA